MQKRKTILIGAVSATVAAGAFGFVVMQSHSATPTSAAGTAAAAVPPLPTTESVLTVTAPIRVGDKFSPANVSSKPVPGSQAPAGALLGSETLVDGKASTKDLTAGAVLTQTDVASSQAAAEPPTGAGLALTPGDVVMSVPYDPTKGVAGYIAPGDHLDVLVSNGAGPAPFGPQDLTVLKVGTSGSTSAAGSTGSTVLVVELDRTQAAVLEYLLQQQTTGGAGAHTVQFVLRSQG